MATITYNNRSVGNSSNLMTFTDIPNILTISDVQSSSPAILYLIPSSSLAGITTSDGQWYITFMGETITNVIDYHNAVNKTFFVSPSSMSTAASMAKAFRACPGIAANFLIEHTTLNSTPCVKLTARKDGSANLASNLDTNITSQYMGQRTEEGTPNVDSQTNLYNSMINLDIFSDGKYITTLEKNFYKDSCSFNLSPVLTTFAVLGHARQYTIDVSSIKNGTYTSIGSIAANYIIPGYMCNQGEKYIPLGNSIIIAQNVSRGASRSTTNNTLLYVYGNSIPLSYYAMPGSTAVTVTYRTSAFNVIATESFSHSYGSDRLHNTTISLNATHMQSAFYVDVAIGGNVLRYNVIKPKKATEYYQRIYWRNSYGGVSFFDFTGARSETRDLSVSTYEKNIFDYYTSQKNELEKIYDNEVKYNVTLKSHLFENDGKYLFNDLAQSSDVWTEINGQTYAIIIDNISVDELSDRNNIYEATVRYRYSMTPPII